MFDRQPKLEKPYIAAIVAAAGSARRMGGLDKQFEEVGGVPVVIRSMMALADSDWIDELVVVTRREEIPRLHTLIRAWAVPKVRSVVGGGETRQQSVRRGLEAVSAHTRFIAVHDGARPLVSARVVAEAVLGGLQYGAAAAAVPVVDTIKIADGEGMIAGTPDRSRLFAVQTPQVFSIGLYQKAMDAADAAGKDYTDDCQMLEAVGVPVRLTRGDYANLKITTPTDLLVARAAVEEVL